MDCPLLADFVAEVACRGRRTVIPSCCGGHRRGRAMMGRLNQDQGRLFYSFCLDEVVPSDHLVRQIAAVLDLSWVHAELRPYYSRMGRPSIDPALMIRMLIIGYVFAIRSERALCREVQVNLAYRWFCSLSIEERIPDHSAFSRARNERFRDSDIFRRVFERVVEACLAAGLVGGEGFAVDASLIAADANKQRSIPGSAWSRTCAPRSCQPRCEGVSRHPQRRGFWWRHRGHPEVRLAIRSRCTVDRSDAGPGILRLRRQLSDRCEVRCHHGCRSIARGSPGGGRRGEDHDRPDRAALRCEARTIGRRHGLRLGADAPLARQRQEDRTAYPGHRQVEAR